jgi:hypothetical protein
VQNTSESIAEQGFWTQIIVLAQKTTLSGQGMKVDLLPNLRIQIADFSLRLRAAGNLTHIRLKQKTVKSNC